MVSAGAFGMSGALARGLLDTGWESDEAWAALTGGLHGLVAGIRRQADAVALRGGDHEGLRRAVPAHRVA